MDLPQGRGGQRLRVEPIEGVAHLHAYLGMEDGRGLVDREGVHAVLQAGQCLQARSREQIRPGRQDLAQLHERRTHLLQVPGQSPSVPRHLRL